MHRASHVCVRAGGVGAAAPPSSVIAVANRDVEGSVVVDADEENSYQPTATGCRDQCLNTTGCNIWVWCGAVSGCANAGSYNRDVWRYQQCWLKYDTPPRPGSRGKFPRAKNLPDQPTGWMSGTTVQNVTDAAPFPQQAYGCNCQSNYTYDNYRFLGVCARLQDYGSACMVDSTCRNAPSTGTPASCASLQPCTVLLDTDLQEQGILVAGDRNSADSAEDCCDQCASIKGCNSWTWCSDSAGCDGERFRFRQCWLKQADPTNLQPKKGYGGSPGWISGVRMAWLPA
ncbi:hypothetical protein PLESTB_000510900 [Pleodorina starrii]|uniref:Apple domain-containing protein n=1 Tax=Pleodorina starrii TaxID=330485 RepID=A0A9W6BHC4_9CHLO|nr:hypothetical protein PLESTB_000510900 [Pleodorina starrii]GLC75052.1 hypothetical protein PLESTF_001587800 [Pleodorina starrii]